MLFKNALRTLKKRYLQLLLLGIIIILSSFIYTSMDYSIEGVKNPSEQFFKDTNQEDFSVGMFDAIMPSDVNFIMSDSSCSSLASLPIDKWPYSLSALKVNNEACYYAILNNRMNEIKQTYSNIDLQVRESKNIYFTNDVGTYRVLFLKDMDRINKSYLVAGNKPVNDNQIAISQTFAKNNDLVIGDTFDVNGKDYTISGFVLFPDYNLALFGKELIIDNQSQTFALVTDNEFENIDGNVNFEIAGVLQNGYTSDEFKTNVINTFNDHSNLDFISNINLTVNNIRSGGIYADIKSGRAMSIFMSVLIASIGLMIVGIMISRVLHSQRGPIGILKSMGYTNNEITKPYIFLIMIMALPAILIGYFLGIQFAEPIKQLFLQFYLLPSEPIKQSLQTVIIAIVLPFTFITVLSFIIVRNLLNQKPVTLLNPEVNSNANFLTKKIGGVFKRLKITSKLQHLLLYRSVVKLIVFLVGMFFAAYLILLSFSMTGIFQRMIYDYYEHTNFNYIGYCDYGTDCKIPSGAEAVIQIPDASVNNQDLTLYGIKPDSNMIPIYDKKNDVITQDLSDGVIISEAAHLGEGFNIGDTLKINVGNKEMNVKVVGISEEYTDKRVYVDITDLSQTLTNTDDYYNSVYSANKLSEDDYSTVININDVINQAGDMNAFMNAFVYMMISISVVIGVIIVYILTVMTIEDNFYNISLFKVIGYNEKEINKMILGGYQLYGVFSFLISVPIAIFSFKLLQRFMAQLFDLQFPIKFYWWQAAAAIAIYLIIFNLAAISAKRNLSKISLQEAMKMYEV